MAVFEVFERRTTPYLPAALVVTPAGRNDGLPLRFTSRLNENTTLADVSGVPSAKWTFRLSWNVYVFASFETFQDCTSSGIGCATSDPRYVNSVSKIPRFTSEAVGSNALCGSEVLISNERSITSVSPVAAFELVPAYAAAAAASATTRTSPIHPPRRMADPVMRFLLCVWASRPLRGTSSSTSRLPSQVQCAPFCATAGRGWRRAAASRRRRAR